MKRALIPMVLVALLAVSACAGEPEQVDLGPPAPDLPLPDLNGLDMAGDLQKGLSLALAADLRSPWGAFTETLSLRSETCPDLYAGSTEEEDEPGMSWKDACTTPGGTAYQGQLHWVSSASSTSDASGSIGQGERALDGKSAIDNGTGHLFGFTGQGSDAVYLSSGPGYSQWTYSASMQATVNGSAIFPGGASYPGGWREDLYINYAGGDTSQLELRGDLYLLQDTFDRFDSISMDLTLDGPEGATAGGCTSEPAGYIGLRDTSAYWYEVVFMPLDSSSTSTSDGVCDGCGTLFVRGLEQPDPVCMDFDWIWSALSPPDLSDFVFSTRY